SKWERPGLEEAPPLARRGGGRHAGAARAFLRPQPFRRKGSFRRSQVLDRVRQGEPRPRDASVSARGGRVSPLALLELHRKIAELAVGRARARDAHGDLPSGRGERLWPGGGRTHRERPRIKARTTDAGEGAAYQDCRVRLVPA